MGATYPRNMDQIRAGPDHAYPAMALLKMIRLNSTNFHVLSETYLFRTLFLVESTNQRNIYFAILSHCLFYIFF